jgi:hypothetical protein
MAALPVQAPASRDSPVSSRHAAHSNTLARIDAALADLQRRREEEETRSRAMMVALANMQETLQALVKGVSKLTKVNSLLGRLVHFDVE